MALARRTSRDALATYSGKRHAVDAFFARVDREARDAVPDKKVTVAYGSAGPSMRPTGRGEVAVPTTGTYHSCRRIFGADRVTLVQEAGTTAKDWATGCENEAVYRIPALGATSTWAYRRCLPRWRSGGGKSSTSVRGLRFVPETRMYHDRDKSSALAIGRLRVMELLGQGRPAPFCYSS